MADEPGKFLLLSKKSLYVDPTYQRTVVKSKTLEIASEWSWVAFGCVSVASRGDGSYYVLDGQHRVVASWSRSDIDELPCMVFTLAGLTEEAKAFVACNTSRKPVAAFDKYKASLVAGDKVARFLDEICQIHGYSVKDDGRACKTVTCVSTCLRLIRYDKKSFPVIFHVAAMLAEKDCTSVGNILIESLALIHRDVPDGGLQNPRLLKRLEQFGSDVLVDSARKMSYRVGKGGAAVWKDGMLNIINRGLKSKFHGRNR